MTIRRLRLRPWLVAMVLLTFAVPITPRTVAVAAGDVSGFFTGCPEPDTTVVNPLNPQNLAVAACNSSAVSTDFGQTWSSPQSVVVPSSLGAGYGSDGDGTLAYDAQGRLFWSYLLANGTNNDTTVAVVQLNPSTGAPIANSAVDVAPGINNDDKEWIAADKTPTSPFVNNLYLVWTRLDTNDVMFSRSTNAGSTWSAPKKVSAGEAFPWPSHVAAAANGDVYVSYHTDTCGSATASVVVLRDSNGGADLAAGNTVQKSSFQAAVTCNVQTASGAIPKTHFWMQGAAGTYILPDPVRPGNVYVVANDDPNHDFSTGDPGDVVLARSTDYGNTWSVSTISHAPANTLQAFPTGAIDQQGNIAVFWYDDRRGLINPGPDGVTGTSDDYYNLDVYGTVSRDGGQTFSNDFRINDQPFDPDAGASCRFGCGGTGDPPPATLRIGEYNGIAAANGVGYVAFTGNTTDNAGNANGQQLLFDVFSMLGVFADRFEPNDAINPGVATDLGSQATYSQPNLTISDNLDEDFFKVEALNTGTMTFQLATNGRVSALKMEVRDNANTVISPTLGPTSASSNTLSVTLPVVAGQPYFLRVFGAGQPPPPFALYSLSISNTPVPVPFGLSVALGSDSGRSSTDSVTNIATPTVSLRVDESAVQGLAFLSSPSTSPGYAVAVFDNGSLAGYASRTSPGNYGFTFSNGAPLTEGANSITARVAVVDASSTHVQGMGGESGSLQVTLDTTKPAKQAAPDLQSSSDTGGVSDDNITTITSPTFGGNAEANALVRLYASNTLVGQGFASPGGTFQITASALNDGVYSITTEQEDLAGNVSDRSDGLNVTIANHGLTLPNAMISPATGNVTVDLGTGQINGFSSPSASGAIGIVGIPAVNVDANGHALTTRGTSGDDNLTYTPNGVQSGQVTQAASPQVLNFTSMGGDFTIDPLAGNDTVTVNGTANPDTINVVTNTTSTVQVNSLKTVNLPTANTERIGISSGAGADTINVTVFNTVNALLSIDAGDPSTINKLADSLNMIAGSGSPSLQNKPGGPVQGSGSAFVTYPKTTNNSTRADYTHVEKVTLSK